MAEFQIVLLPRKGYWEWVRVCQDYALAFGVNFTSDPAVAGRMMAPRQVITFPDFPEGYSESKNMVGWYQKRFPGIRLDAIGVSSPDELAREFRKRIKAKDRYGQRLRPFYLLWATDYPVVTQTFGANPQVYQRYGLPGHEGLDMRALTNTNIYAAFDGEVYEVFRNAKAHAYGIHIRLRHRDGYKTVYAHLAKPLVAPGQVVKGGELIGKADSTGASTGAHLHLTLKRDAATARGETRYPKDIIDPTPFIVWPEGYRLKSVQAKSWPTERCLVGAVARIGGPPRPADLDLVARARLEAVSIDVSTPDETIGELRRLHPGIVLVGAVGGDFGGEGVEVNAFLDTVMGDARRLVMQGVRNLELLSAPNLQSGGWRRSWEDGRSFAAWWLEAAAKLRSELPEVRLGFPGLDPGGDIGGWRASTFRFSSRRARRRTTPIGSACMPTGRTRPGCAVSRGGGGMSKSSIDFQTSGLSSLASPTHAAMSPQATRCGSTLSITGRRRANQPLPPRYAARCLRSEGIKMCAGAGKTGRTVAMQDR
jgi:murein DD-endopeptidase MepM/ murein hydrolase activator NlpD